MLEMANYDRVRPDWSPKSYRLGIFETGDTQRFEQWGIEGHRCRGIGWIRLSITQLSTQALGSR